MLPECQIAAVVVEAAVADAEVVIVAFEVVAENAAYSAGFGDVYGLVDT